MATRTQETLGETVRRLREAQDLTRRALATESGVSLRYLGYIERGEPKGANPTRDVLIALAEVLGEEIYPAAFPGVAILSQARKGKRATASKLGWPDWPTLASTGSLALAGR